MSDSSCHRAPLSLRVADSTAASSVVAAASQPASSLRLRLTDCIVLYCTWLGMAQEGDDARALRIVASLCCAVLCGAVLCCADWRECDAVVSMPTVAQRRARPAAGRLPLNGGQAAHWRLPAGAVLLAGCCRWGFAGCCGARVWNVQNVSFVHASSCPARRPRAGRTPARRRRATGRLPSRRG